MNAGAVLAAAAALSVGVCVFAQEVPASSPEPEPIEQSGEVPTIPVEAGEVEPVPAGATLLDPIEVTGSRIRRTDYETAQPILVITREDIERTGLTSIGDILQNLAIAGSAPNTQFGIAGTGAVNVDIRHLGALRVLMLVNGHRWVNGVNALNTGAADYTTIPISIIERVEVLKDSASAIYGSDAISGVINIITRKDYHGAEFRTYAGLYDTGDGLTQAHNLSLGRVTGPTSLFVDLSYTRQDGVFNGDRDFTRIAVPGAGNSRGTTFTPQGLIGFVPTPENESALTAQDPKNCPGPPNLPTFGTVPVGPYCMIKADHSKAPLPFSYFNFSGVDADFYSTFPLLPLLTPNERTALFGQFSRQLMDSIHFNGELLYNQRRSRQQLSPNGISVGDVIGFMPENEIFIDRDNLYNPFDQDIGRGPNGTQGVGTGEVWRRLTEQGPRLFSQDVDTWRGGAALSGPLDLEAVGISRQLDWEIGYSYAQSRQKEAEENMVNYDHVRRALGPPAECDPECVPLDLFHGQGPDGRGTITREMLDYIEHDGHNSTRVVARDAFGNFRTELFDLAGGPLALAFGVELREEDYTHNPDPLVAFGNATFGRQPTVGGYSAKEIYVEFGVPILKDAPLAEALEVSLAGRYSDYARFGRSNTGKLGLRWKPLSDLLVRGTYGTAFRTPSVTEAFLGAGDRTLTVASDPCTTANQSDHDNYPANCAEDEASPAYSDVIVFHSVVTGGNPDLEPEAARTVSAGVVYSPRFLEDLNLVLDWYRISVDDFIFSPGVQFILDACYKAEPGRRAFCDRVLRRANDQIEYIHSTFLNLPRLETEGLDVSFGYRLPGSGDFGVFKLLADFAYLDEIKLFTQTASSLPNTTTVGGEAVTSGAGRFLALGFSFPRWKGNLALDWSQELWSASWSVRYIHLMRENCFDGREPSLRDLGLCSDPDPVVAENDLTTPDVDEGNPDESETVIKATFYHDVQIGYLLADWDTKLGLGVTNLLDQDPPRVYSIGGPHAYSYDPTTYDIPGRFLYLRLQKSF